MHKNMDIYMYIFHLWRCGVVVTTAHLYSINSHVRFCASSYPAGDVTCRRFTTVRASDNGSKKRLNTFCRFTIRQKKFISSICNIMLSITFYLPPMGNIKKVHTSISHHGSIAFHFPSS